jgi:3D (Asp-Asp-Asp) domain-containing protein
MKNLLIATLMILLVICGVSLWGMNNCCTSAFESANVWRVEVDKLQTTVEILVAERDGKEKELVRISEAVKSLDIYKEHNLSVSAYTARKEECDTTPNKTATMVHPTVGTTVAVSPDLAHWLGKWVKIEGVGIRKVEDLMNSRFTNRLDVLMPSVKMATQFGRKDLQVVLIGESL